LIFAAANVSPHKCSDERAGLNWLPVNLEAGEVAVTAVPLPNSFCRSHPAFAFGGAKI